MPNGYEELRRLDLSQKIDVAQGELSRCWDAYAAYSTGLRTWFVAYGGGLLALYITDHEAFSSLGPVVKAGVAVLFASGALVQIIIAGINKHENYAWFAYWDKYFQYLDAVGDDVPLEVASAPQITPIKWDARLDVFSGACFLLGTVWLGAALLLI